MTRGRPSPRRTFRAFVLVAERCISGATGALRTGVRFLVDGQPHDTLAGHADLLRTYPATNTEAKPTPPIEPTGN